MIKNVNGWDTNYKNSFIVIYCLKLWVFFNNYDFMTIIVLKSIVSTTLKSYLLETIHYIVVKQEKQL